MARGEITAATVSFNNAFGAQIAGAPITLVIPEEGVSGSINPMGLTPAGLDSPAAKVFFNWTMSQEGQRFAAAQGFVPAREGMEPQKSGEYQLPAATSELFQLYSPEDFTRYGEEDERAWKRAFNYMG